MLRSSGVDCIFDSSADRLSHLVNRTTEWSVDIERDAARPVLLTRSNQIGRGVHDDGRRRSPTYRAGVQT